MRSLRSHVHVRTCRLCSLSSTTAIRTILPRHGQIFHSTSFACRFPVNRSQLHSQERQPRKTMTRANNRRVTLAVPSAVPNDEDDMPRRPDGEPAWFTYEHNAYLERLLEYHPGGVLQMYQTHLADAAQHVLAEHSDVSPPAYEFCDRQRPLLVRVLAVPRRRTSLQGGQTGHGRRSPPAAVSGNGVTGRAARRPCATSPTMREREPASRRSPPAPAGQMGRRMSFSVGGPAARQGRSSPQFPAGVPARKPLPPSVQWGRGGGGSDGGEGSVSTRTRSQSAASSPNGPRRS